ncbi:DUF1523 family protein [Asticcacaulis sp. YBE204]|uniref:DUF1523 family protein n=1 Tax=Asticcacaulis sp. YBE204 TaxID=1282363 RepID=UPI0003C3FB43|nr:DUF1523 family protein [Asticcacaulis sp. YBE204]ESQ78824.1 hypothetical protein AEYBE204_12640 [Asticcacaulis sp. YBE204]
MSKFKTVTFTILGVIAFGVVAWATIPYWSQGSAVVEVTGTTTKRQGGKDQYLVFTTTGTYKNTDSLHYLKFDSSDLQGKLNRPGRYRINYYGFRVPVLSMYKNITKAETIA